MIVLNYLINQEFHRLTRILSLLLLCDLCAFFATFAVNGFPFVFDHLLFVASWRVAIFY